jgi:hypothetical protein
MVGKKAPAPFARLSALAWELGMDPRTLKRCLDGQPFVHQVSERVAIVDRAAFETWWTQHGRRSR